MSVKLVIYSIKKVYGIDTLSIDLTSRITEVKHNEYVMVDVPGLFIKKCNFYAYVTKSYIFDCGSHVFFIADYKKVNRTFALKYLQKYFLDGRPNHKNYNLKTPKRIKYEPSNN